MVPLTVITFHPLGAHAVSKGDKELSMKRAKPGDQVTIEYEGILDNGEIFETTRESGPLEFILGTGSVMPAFETAILGMAVSDSKDVVLAPKDGYGERQKDLLQTISRELFGPDVDLRLGQILKLKVKKEGTTHQVPATVVELTEDTVTVDYNHPLAGHTLTYKVTLKTIKDAEVPLPIVTDPDQAAPGKQ